MRAHQRASRHQNPRLEAEQRPSAGQRSRGTRPGVHGSAMHVGYPWCGGVRHSE